METTKSIVAVSTQESANDSCRVAMIDGKVSPSAYGVGSFADRTLSMLLGEHLVVSAVWKSERLFYLVISEAVRVIATALVVVGVGLRLVCSTPSVVSFQPTFLAALIEPIVCAARGIKHFCRQILFASSTPLQPGRGLSARRLHVVAASFLSRARLAVAVSAVGTFLGARKFFQRLRLRTSFTELFHSSDPMWLIGNCKLRDSVEQGV